MRQGRLHPARIVTGALGGRTLGTVRRWVVKHLYTHLARAYPLPEWTTMNYGYVPFAPAGTRASVAAPTGLPVSPVPTDDVERLGLNLYWRVATAGHRGAALGGLDIVEVGSGRGGGAAFLATAVHPRRLLGIDIAPTATSLAAARYASIASLGFQTGDAEALGLADASADIVINIESAHCYASVPRFLAEVARVLRPGGELLFAGFAARGEAHDRLVAALTQSSLRLDGIDDITANITASLAEDEARKRAFLDTNVTGFFKSFAVGAYAMTGSPMRRGLDSGETVYLAAVLSKP